MVLVKYCKIKVSKQTLFFSILYLPEAGKFSTFYLRRYNERSRDYDYQLVLLVLHFSDIPHFWKILKVKRPKYCPFELRNVSI